MIRAIVLGLIVQGLMTACADESAHTVDAPLEMENTHWPDSASEQPTERQRLIDSLTGDLDKEQLLKLFGFSNSGIGKSVYLFTPDTPGFHYSYFVFQPIDRQPSESIDGVRVTTFKFGSEVGRYNENEMLVEIQAKVADDRLGRMNLVGTKSTLFIDQPELTFTSDSTMVLQDGARLLLLHLSKGNVDWFKYALVKGPFDSMIDSERKLLLTYWSDKNDKP